MRAVCFEYPSQATARVLPRYWLVAGLQRCVLPVKAASGRPV